jgi:hypothetical protein
MVNAWSLAASILGGTFDKDYPIMKKKEVEHSDAYYDYTRNDLNAENPFTDPVDRARAERVVGNTDKDLESIKNSGGFEWTPGSPWPPSEFGIQTSDSDDGLDYEVNLYDGSSADYYDKYMADVDDQRAHHFQTGNVEFNYEPKTAHFYKYHEEEILKDIEEYVSGTYQGHYTGNSHEFRKVQTIDLMASKDLAAAFCQANILKYGSRYGNKDGKNKKDLLKVIHYAMLLAHFDGHYGEPSMPSGNFDQMP